MLMHDQAPDLPALLACLSPDLPVFRAALLAQADGGLTRLDLNRGEILLQRGETANALYIITAGQLRATAIRADGSELTLSEFGPGEMAGEMALLAGGGVYSASVSASQDTVLVKVPRATFEKIVKATPEAEHEMSEGIRRRIARDQLAAGLTSLFGPLDHEILWYVESRVEWVRLQTGETLFVEGDDGHDLYFVLGGRLRAVAADGRFLSEMGRGESIGEIALLTGEPRTATVVAIRDSALVRVSRQTFDDLVERYPGLMRMIAQLVVRRLRAKERTDPAKATGMCIAVLGAGAKASIAGFTERLVNALDSIGPTMHLSSERVEALLNRPGIAAVDKDNAAGLRLTAWLDELESRYRFVVYEADSTASAWARRCLRQADEILLVAQANVNSALNAVEQALLGVDRPVSKARCSLVLLHRDGSRLPSGTSRWFTGRNVQRQFHVRMDSQQDLHRVARCLAGVAIGLVLGGGGARGLAHIGVIRAFREARLPIDMIGGTSMGAVMAGMLGMGFDWKTMLELNRDGWLRQKPHRQYALPFISLIRSKGIDFMAKSVYGDTDIEDLWLGFFCVSSNLSTSEIAVHERGPLWKAVRASTSLPGVFVPVLRDGNVHVDGGIMNNLPGDIMRQRSCATVIVVDVGSVQAFTVGVPEFPSPWRFLWSRIAPLAAHIDIPTIAALLMRTTEVSSIQKTAEVKKDADVCLRPPLDRYGILQFESLDEIAEVGYRYAREKLQRLGDDKSLAGLFPS